MGLGLKGDTGRHHTILDNLPSMLSKFQYKDGFFGSPGEGRSYVRNISSTDPVQTAKDFYDTASHGGLEQEMDNGKGLTTKMADGTILSFREISSSSDNSPAVEINIRYSNNHGSIKYQKIHFVKE